MEELFLLVLNKSFAASWVIGILLLLRLVLRKLPTGVRYALWAVALVRLLVPISVESALSLLPVNRGSTRRSTRCCPRRWRRPAPIPCRCSLPWARGSGWRERGRSFSAEPSPWLASPAV